MGAASSIHWSHINFGQMGTLLVKVEWGWKRLIVRQQVNCSVVPSHLWEIIITKGGVAWTPMLMHVCVKHKLTQLSPVWLWFMMWINADATLKNITIDRELSPASLCPFILEQKASHSLTYSDSSSSWLLKQPVPRTPGGFLPRIRTYVQLWCCRHQAPCGWKLSSSVSSLYHFFRYNLFLSLKQNQVSLNYH